MSTGRAIRPGKAAQTHPGGNFSSLLPKRKLCFCECCTNYECSEGAATLTGPCLRAQPEARDASHSGSEQPRFSLGTGIMTFTNHVTRYPTPTVLGTVCSSPGQGGRGREGGPLDQFRDQGQIYMPVKKGQSLSLSPWVHIPSQGSMGTWPPARD